MEKSCISILFNHYNNLKYCIALWKLNLVKMIFWRSMPYEKDCICALGGLTFVAQFVDIDLAKLRNLNFWEIDFWRSMTCEKNCIFALYGITFVSQFVNIDLWIIFCGIMVTLEEVSFFPQLCPCSTGYLSLVFGDFLWVKLHLNIFQGNLFDSFIKHIWTTCAWWLRRGVTIFMRMYERGCLHETLHSCPIKNLGFSFHKTDSWTHCGVVI